MDPATDPKPASLKAPVAGVGIAALSVLLIGLLEPSEGGRRLVPYLDSVGIPTACTGIIGPEVARRHKAKLRFTEAECVALETAYLGRMVRDMQKCVPQHVLNTVTTGEFLAYGHWAYNTGTGAFCRSSLNRHLRAGDHVRACQAMGQWTFVTLNGRKVDCRTAGKLCPGIVKRRRMEVSMCLDSLN